MLNVQKINTKLQVIKHTTSTMNKTGRNNMPITGMRKQTYRKICAMLQDQLTETAQTYKTNMEAMMETINALEANIYGKRHQQPPAY